MNTICAADWTIDADREPRGARIEVKRWGSHQFVLTNSGRTLEAFLRKSARRFDAVIADLVPPPVHEASTLEWKSWVHSTQGVLRLCERLRAPGGKVILELSDNALLHVRLLTSLDTLEVLAWKKKYAPQNDSSRLIEPMHDFVLVLGRQEESTIAGTRFLPWQVAGKSEDGTREFQEILRRLELVGRSPAAIKPRAFWRWCAQNLVDNPKSVIDLSYSGHGIGDEVGGECDVTNVIWSHQEDAHIIFSSVSARLANGLSDVEPIEEIEKTSARPCTCLQNFARVENGSENKILTPSLYLTGVVDDVKSVVCRGGGSSSEVVERYFRDSADVVHLHSKPEIPQLEMLSIMLGPNGIATVPALTGLTDRQIIKKLMRSFNFVGSLVVVGDQQSVEHCELRMVLSKRLSDTAQLNKMRPVTLSDYVCTDEDPRGSWRDPGHKGARSGSSATAFEIHVPPYRWKRVSGDLPPGMWRLNSDTGIVWGTPTQSGEWICEVQVDDEESSVKAFVRLVVSDEHVVQLEHELERVRSWLTKPAPSTGALTFENQTHYLQTGVPQFVQLTCFGGRPRRELIGAPGSPAGQSRTRFWEFSLSSFLQAVCEDRAIWGRTRDGKVSTSRPRIKKYQRDEPIRNTAIRSVLVKPDIASTDDFLREYLPARVVVEIDGNDIRTLRDNALAPQVTVEPEVCVTCENDVLGFSCSPEHGLQRLGFFCGQKLLNFELQNSSIGYRWVFDITGQQVGVFIPDHIVTDDLVTKLQDTVGGGVSRFFGNRIYDRNETHWKLTKVDHR